MLHVDQEHEQRRIAPRVDISKLTLCQRINLSIREAGAGVLEQGRQ